jgi:hypothetical protein
MISVGTRVIYKAFGLNIISDIILPELPNVNLQFDRVDVEIKIKDLSEEWKRLISDKETYLVKENIILFKIPDTAIFCIKDGNKVIISPIEGSDEKKIRLFLLGTCLGALLIQRKVIPLHGSAIEIDGKAYAIIGESGAGKSTLASAFLQKGYKLLSDDVIAVSFSDNHIPFVTPSYPQQKLWQESLDAFGMDFNKYHPIIERETKFSIPVSKSYFNESVPLGGIFELDKTEDEEISLLRIVGLEQLKLLFAHTYRNFLIELLGLMEWHFTSSTRIVEHINIYQIHRPVSKFTAHDLVSVILESIYKENK